MMRPEKFLSYTVGIIDWEGWKEFVIPMAPTPTHWGGNRDGKIDPPAIIHDIAIEWQPGAKAKGTIYLDDVSMETTIPPYGDATLGLAGPTFATRNSKVPFSFSVVGFPESAGDEFQSHGGIDFD